MAEFEVQCDQCGKDVYADFYANGSRIILSVEPCEECMEAARNEGREEE